MDKEQRMHKDPDERKAYQHAYYMKHKDVLNARHNEWNHAHMEQMREYSKRYYRAHKKAKAERKEGLA